MTHFQVEFNGKNYWLTPMLRMLKHPNGNISLQQALQLVVDPSLQNGKPPEIAWADVPVLEVEPPKSAIISPGGKPYLKPV